MLTSARGWNGGEFHLRAWDWVVRQRSRLIGHPGSTPCGLVNSQWRFIKASFVVRQGPRQGCTEPRKVRSMLHVARMNKALRQVWTPVVRPCDCCAANGMIADERVSEPAMPHVLMSHWEWHSDPIVEMTLSKAHILLAMNEPGRISCRR